MTATVGGGGPGQFVGMVRTPAGGQVEVFTDDDGHWMRVADGVGRVTLTHLPGPLRDLLVVLLIGDAAIQRMREGDPQT